MISEPVRRCAGCGVLDGAAHWPGCAVDEHARYEAEKRRKRAELAARVEAELPPSEPEGLYQFAPSPWSGVGPFSLEENLTAMARYIEGRYGPDACERCGGARRVLDRDFPHGPRWVPCPSCRPLSWATGEQLRREGPLVDAVERRQSEFERDFAELFRLEMELREQVDRMLRPPWWARAIAWGIAAGYAVGSLRGRHSR